jgi:hypothetical protein
MPGNIVELLFPEGVVIDPRHPYDDQALLSARERDPVSHQILPVGKYDLTPLVPTEPPLEYSLTVHPNGIGEIRSACITSSSSIEARYPVEVDDPDLKAPPVRTINQEVQQQFITGLSDEQLLLFAYLFYIPDENDARLAALEFFKQQRKNKR